MARRRPWIDRAIAHISPSWALRRAEARRRLEYLARASQYEAARPDRNRRGTRYSTSANRAVESGSASIREQARHLERNFDIARGALSTLVRNTIGANGIQVEPQPRDLDGRIHDEFAEVLRAAYTEWSLRPEVTWRHDWPGGQRILARSWYRDGDVFAQRLPGRVPRLDHGTIVPYSLELLEADMVPLNYNLDDPAARIVQGIEHNVWGRPRRYHVYRQHPGDTIRGIPEASALKAIPASRMLHLASRDRIGQVRGMSLFASILARFEHVKDYEESEAVAAKVAASMAAVITKGNPDTYNPDTGGAPREMTFVPGMVFDDLLPGENITTIDTSRPNTNVEAHRAGQLRAAAGGLEVGGSDLTKDYTEGNYSGMRQETVTQWAAYAVLGADFTNAMARPVYTDVVDIAILSQAVEVPDDVDMSTVHHALYSPVPMPWIDPQREAGAFETLTGNMLESAIRVIRQRGRSPRDVVDEIARYQRMLTDAGVEATPAAAGNPAIEELDNVATG